MFKQNHVVSAGLWIAALAGMGTALVTSAVSAQNYPSRPVRVVKANNAKELIALGASNPNGQTYASTGTGGITHLATELMMNR